MDPNNLAQLPSYQRAELDKFVEDQQMKDSIKNYNYLVEHCFDQCVKNGWGGGLTSKRLDDAEATCIDNCAAKYMKLSQRVGFRFVEAQAQKQMEQQQTPK